MQLNRLASFLVLFVFVCISGCSESALDITSTPSTEGVEVGFYAGGTTTRTTIGEDGISTNWSADDKVSLWAVNSVGNTVLSNQSFGVYFRDLPASKAFFTTTLASAMTNDTYTYYATYPTPKSVSGTTATFTVPSTQDGKISGGAAILVATPTQAGALSTVTHLPGDYEVADPHLSLQMNHALHALRFYIPSTKWGFAEGESIESIRFSMPQAVAGDITLDYTNPSATPTVSNTTNAIEIYPTESIGASASAAEIDHACASIIPTTVFANDDVIDIEVYTQTQVAHHSISLAGRDAMLAGHITPVSINCSDPQSRPHITFKITTNNLGENPYRITLTSSDTSTKWKGNDDHVYEYYTGSSSSTLAVNSGFTIYYDDNTLSTISGRNVTVTYESESAIVSNTITMPTMTVGNSYDVNLTVPYLMFQNFSALAEYTDEATTGSKTLDSVGLPGWTASRTNGSAGSHIRLRPFWVFGARYQGRLDSEYFGSRLKKSVTVSVTINAGAEKVNTPLQVGKTTQSGAIEAGTAIESVSTTLTLAKGTNSSRPEFTYTVTGVTANHRLSWRTNITSGSWLTYSDTPIDNIKVQIVQ